MPRMDLRGLAWKQIKAKSTRGQWTDSRDVERMETIGLSDSVSDGGKEKEESEMSPGVGLVQWIDDVCNWGRSREQCACVWQGC